MNIKQRLKSVTQALSMILMWSWMFAALADDIDIFSNAVESKPNILFILDTSNSMRENSIYDENGVKIDTRIEVLKHTMHSLISDMDNVNVGMMSFYRHDNKGGKISQVVKDINSPVKRHNRPDVVMSQDDGYENLVTAEVSSDGGYQYFGYDRRYDDYTLTPHEVDKTPIASNQQSLISGQDNFFSTFEVSEDNIIGLRFTNFLNNFPADADFSSASIDLTAAETASEPIKLLMKAEVSDEPAAFSSDTDDLKNRWENHSTTATGEFNEYDSETLDDASATVEATGVEWTAGEAKSFSISEIISELLEEDNFDPEDDLVIFIRAEKDGVRDLIASGQGAPKLTINFHQLDRGDPTDEKLLTGMRYEQVGVPQGATITRAYIQFTRYFREEWRDGDTWQFLIRAEDSAHPLPFTGEAGSLSARSKTSQLAYFKKSDSRTADVTNLVQALVNQSDWCGQQAMAFFFEPDPTMPKAYVRDDTFDRGRHAELHIEYTTSGTPGCHDQHWSQRIAKHEHDAEQKNGTVELNEEIPTISSSELHGFRFINVPLDPGTQIKEAYLELHNHSENVDALVDIYGEKIGDSSAFIQGDSQPLSNRDKTTARVMGALSTLDRNEPYRTPNIANIVQEIIDGDWSKGNALTLFLEGVSGEAQYRALNSSLSTSPRLVLRFANSSSVENDYTVRDNLKKIVSLLSNEVGGLTPTTGALYEAARYFRGSTIHLGRSGGNIDDLVNRRFLPPHDYKSECRHNYPMGLTCEYDGGWGLGSRDYKSPIKEDCASNHIIYLTDGVPNSNDYTDAINDYLGTGDCTGDSSIEGQQCARTLVEWMANGDMANYSENPQLTQMDHRVFTHTVAFGLDDPQAISFLKDLAHLGKGGFYNSETALDLANTFHAIITSVLANGNTFSFPAVSIDQYNRLSHSNDVYFSFFEVANSAYWKGNVKKYQYRGLPAVLQGENEVQGGAVSEDDGSIKDGVQSYWSPSADGSNVALGGAASQIPLAANRHLYTHLPSVEGATKDLDTDVNRLVLSNEFITAEQLGVSTQSDRDDLVQWIRGEDVLEVNQSSLARKAMGSIMHSTPASVTYSVNEANGTSDTTLFVGTNEGFLHAIDVNNGKEQFAFMPEALMDNILDQYRNVDGMRPVYGLDGDITVWVQDVDGDGIGGQGPNASEDFVYLYVGMRRGGRHYYALDVTDRTSPKMLWDNGGIFGGSSVGFERLGQTWSKPMLTKIKRNGQPIDVLVFSGGFDPKYDTFKTTQVTADIGNALYIVNAKTGELIWRASNSSSYDLNLPEMRYAIPSDLSVIDLNRDGFADQFYVGDLGGQLWRFDLTVNSSGDTKIDGGVIADVVQDTTALNNRRFFNKPSVSRFTLDGVTKLAVAIGSGETNAPKQMTTENHFYVVYQPMTTTGYPKLAPESGLKDMTDIENNHLVPSDGGWYIKLREGEKSLSKPLVINGRVLFTTYQPSTLQLACSQGVGNAYVYHMNLLRANAAADRDGNGLMNVNDRYRRLKTHSIPPQPKAIFLENNKTVVSIGLEVFPDMDSLRLPEGWQTNSWAEVNK